MEQTCTQDARKMKRSARLWTVDDHSHSTARVFTALLLPLGSTSVTHFLRCDHGVMVM